MSFKKSIHPSMLLKLAHWGFVIAFVTFLLSIYACTERKKLPVDSLLEESIRGPQQSSITMDAFEFEYEGRRFSVTPKAFYELNGLIVTHNDVTSITDAYHDSKEVAFRDICVSWGENLSSGIYRKVRYWSEPWSCHVQFNSATDAQYFRPDQFSNTHLLTAKNDVRDLVRSATYGDQIWARGVLVDYCPVGAPQFTRKSSLIRTDGGDGACEVMFIDDFQILKKTASPWPFYYNFSRRLWPLILILSAALWLYAIFIESSAKSRLLATKKYEQQMRFNGNKKAHQKNISDGPI